jgi:hypothetical protein
MTVMCGSGMQSGAPGGVRGPRLGQRRHQLRTPHRHYRSAGPTFINIVISTIYIVVSYINVILISKTI